jgi:hypothetical protein
MITVAPVPASTGSTEMELLLQAVSTTYEPILGPATFT